MEYFTSPQSAHSTQKKILIADDVQLNRLVMRQLLESRGYTVSEVANGAEALEKLKTATFHLAIIDLKMPELDGMSVIKAYRSAVSSSIPIIVITTDPSSTVKEAILAAGAVAIIERPLSHENFSTVLEKIPH